MAFTFYEAVTSMCLVLLINNLLDSDNRLTRNAFLVPGIISSVGTGTGAGAVVGGTVITFLVGGYCSVYSSNILLAFSFSLFLSSFFLATK